jgi:hypothetical protein
MDLVAARIDAAWTCPVHQQQQISATPGRCKLDGRELVPVYVGLYWQCADQPGIRLTDPGNCSNGRPRELVRELRAHGDHNPRHGGLFFMASDKWHHLEGTYPQDGLVRIYLYDNFTQPKAIKGVSGRIVSRDDNGQELASFPLRPSKDGKTLEAQVKDAKLPLQVALKIKLDDRVPEQHFDFLFKEISKEPDVVPTATTKRAMPPTPATVQPVVKPAPQTTAAAPAAGALAPKEEPTPSAPTTPMPTMTAADITSCPTTVSRNDVAQLSETVQRSGSSIKVLLNLLLLCDTEVKTLIEASEFGYVYQPTMFSKDVGLALETHVNELPAAQRVPATAAIKRLVVAAWLLDAYGDTGNKVKLTDAYTQFAAAIADIKTAYGAAAK